MAALLYAKPFVRTAHYYQFPIDRNPAEATRIGYCYAIHLVAGGSGEVTVAGKVYPLKKGDLIYIPPRVKHAFYANPEHPLATYNLYIDIWNYRSTEQHLVWHEADFNIELLTKIRACPELERIATVTPIQYHSFIGQSIIQAVGHIGKESQYRNVIISKLLTIILLEMTELSDAESYVDYRIAALIKQVDKKAVSNEAYREWVEQSGVKKTQLHVLFKQATGMSPKVYWTQAIMKNIETALLESNRTITLIAEDFGFSSVHHFTKQFTRYHGVSPTEFRKSKH